LNHSFSRDDYRIQQEPVTGKQQQEMIVPAQDSGEEKARRYEKKTDKVRPERRAREKGVKLIAANLNQKSDNDSQSYNTHRTRRSKKIPTMMSNIVILLLRFLRQVSGFENTSDWKESSHRLPVHDCQVSIILRLWYLCEP